MHLEKLGYLISDWTCRHWINNQKSAEFVAQNMCLGIREMYEVRLSSIFSADLINASIDLGMQNGWYSHSNLWSILSELFYRGKECLVVQHCVQNYSLFNHTEAENAFNLFAKSFKCQNDVLSTWLIKNYPTFRNLGFGNDAHLKQNDSEEQYVAFKDAIRSSSVNVVKLFDEIDHDVFSVTEKLIISTVCFLLLLTLRIGSIIC